ncbi:MAG: bifunctional serine/threonine-protein kinase/formylglycine-generating enzyme family protein [Bacteroidales bacterium]|nr:bifunctional serine/threonine-protein kinase/formylglycine-generating enzyme family protein [Bacteroidales bacterium]
MYLTDGTLLQGGKFRIVRHISSGGFGNTYEGIHTMMDTRVAIKEFFPKMFCNRDESTSHITVATHSNRALVEKLRKKFVDEAKSIFKMNHPNIVKVHDIFEENGTAYYVMDFIDGQSLGDILKVRGALPEAEAVGYVRQVADALKYVHSLNRLHLDIKPGNVMLDSDNRTILIDFGASKHYDDGTGENTSTLMGMNTPGYAPPEQMSRSFSDFNPTADVYALGATLYRLLTNITPPDSIMLMSGDEELDPLPSTVSAATQNAVAKAMIPQRKRRLQSIGEFLTLLGGHPTPGVSDEMTVVKEEETLVKVENTVVVAPSKPRLENRTFNVKGVSFTMVAVEGGTFLMGSDDPESNANEKPVHTVTLSDYYICQTQVTQALWYVVMGNNPSYYKGNDLPVERVSWDDCQTFIKKLNNLTGHNFRLPTEAEWEYAARGGNNSRGYKYSGSNNIAEVAWYEDNSYTHKGWLGIMKDEQTHPVATKKANEIGIYDMSGNVYEWCQDWYERSYYSSSAQTNPKGPSSGSYHVYRGGSWNSYARRCRVANRFNDTPFYCVNILGLRLAL